MSAAVISGMTADRLRALLAKRDPRPIPPSRQSPVGRYPLFARCTSTTPAAGSGVGAECYPAVVVDPDSSVLVADQPELGDVWLTLISDGVAATPTVDTIYPVLLAGEFDPGSDSRLRVFSAGPAAAGGGSITVKEVDGSPSVGSVTELRFDQTDGIVVSTPGAGIARVDLASATASQVGVVNTATQTFGGEKSFEDSVYVNTTSSSPGGDPHSNFTARSTDAGATLSGQFALQVEVAGTPSSVVTLYVFREGYDYAYAAGSAVNGAYNFASGALQNVFAGYVIVGGNSACPLQTNLFAGFGETGPYTWMQTSIQANTDYTINGLTDYDNAGGGNKHLVLFTYASSPVYLVSKTGFGVGGPGSYSYGLSGTLGFGATATGGIITALGGGTEAANTVFAGPSSGGAAAPSFRALVPADMPVQGAVTDLTDSTGGSAGSTIAAVSGTGDDTGINNALASLIATINALQAQLRSFGAVT